MNHRVDIGEDIKWCQETLSCASSKVDYSMGESIYLHPIDSDGRFSLEKNDRVNMPEK